MIELLIALFGGMYLCARIASDKSTSKAFDRSMEKRNAWYTERQEQWREQVTDRALEEDLSYFISDPANYDKVWEEVHAAYQQMPSCKDFTQILLYEYMVAAQYGKSQYTKKQRENIAASNRRNALYIMLARRGKVRDGDTWGSSPVTYLHRGEGEHTRRAWDEEFDFWVYIRDELRRHEVNARLIFVEDWDVTEWRHQAYDVDDVEKFRYKSGAITWLPLTYFDDNLEANS